MPSHAYNHVKQKNIKNSDITSAARFKISSCCRRRCSWRAGSRHNAISSKTDRKLAATPSRLVPTSFTRKSAAYMHRLREFPQNNIVSHSCILQKSLRTTASLCIILNIPCINSIHSLNAATNEDIFSNRLDLLSKGSQRKGRSV